MKKEIIGALYKSCDINEKILLYDILNSFSDAFNRKKAQNFSGSFRFLINCDGEQVVFNIQVNNTDFKIINNNIDIDTYLNIKCDFKMFCNITLGNFNPVIDVIKKNIILDKGLLSLPRFAKFHSLFSYRDIPLTLPTSIKHSKYWKKPGKILLVNGSPRKNASTKLMLEWFIQGLPEDKVDIIDVSSLKMEKCLHCYSCWTNHPEKCVYEDDSRIFREKMDSADLIVFFVPLSYSTMPSDMKRALEKLFPETTPFFYHNKITNKTAHPVQKNRKSQAFLQFLVWGFPEIEHGRILEENFVEWANHSHKNYLGCLKRPGINMILSDPRMQQIRKIIKSAVIQTARSVYETGKIPVKQKKIIEKADYISTKDFQFFATNYWIKRFKTGIWK